MGIEVISQLQKEIDTLKKKLDSTKTEAEKKVEELKKQFEQEWVQRKTAFSQENTISDTTLRKAKDDGINLYLKSVLMGRPVDSFNEFKDVANVIEKAIKPADIADWLAEEFSNKVLASDVLILLYSFALLMIFSGRS